MLFRSQEKIIERIKENIGEFENGLQKLIKNLLDILLNFAPSQILEAFATKYSLSTAEFFTSNNHKDDLKLVKLDYILSLMTSFSDVDFGKNEFAYEKFEEAQEILEKILMQSMFYLMFTSEHKGELSEVKFVQTLHHMVVRGDSYSIHKVQMCRELFTQYDDVLKSKFSLTANQLIDIFIEVAEIPLKRLEIQKNYYLEVKKLIKNLFQLWILCQMKKKWIFSETIKIPK